MWKVPAEGGEAVQVTRQGGQEAIESSDGKTLYYSKSTGGSWSIWKVPVAGGEEMRILDPIRSKGTWAVLGHGIYFIAPNTKRGAIIQFLSFATGQVRQIAALDKDLVRGPPVLAVSPDARWILYAQVDQSNSDIMLVENFR